MLDPTVNFGRVNVSTGYSSSATSVVLSSGEGSKLPNPSTDGAFNLGYWDKKNYPNASDDPNKEIVRVAEISGDTLTIVRGQENTTATDKNTTGGEYVMILAPTKKMMDDIDAGIVGWNSVTDVIPTRDSTDDPTYVINFAGVDITDKVSVGQKITWKQNSTTRYGFVTAISFSTDTSLTLYGGTDYDVDDTATYTISDVKFSSMQAPYGFPLDPDKWSVEAIDTSNNSTAPPAQNTKYNKLSLSIPIGNWNVMYRAYYSIADSDVDWIRGEITLSTSAITESDLNWTTSIGAKNTYNSSEEATNQVCSANGIINTTTKSTRYLNVWTTYAGVNWIQTVGAISPTIIKATITYL